MTPTETATILRQFNDWRRDLDNKVEQPDPREIGKAIDAAIGMIDRLESAESDAFEQARLNGMGASREAALLAKLEAAEKERDWNAERLEDAIEELTALRVKIEVMEKQEPVAWMSSRNGFIVKDSKNHDYNLPLYPAPGAKGE